MDEQRNDHLLPRLQSTADNYADAVMIQRSFPQIPPEQLHAKMARGDIARNSTLVRKLQTPDGGQHSENKLLVNDSGLGSKNDLHLSSIASSDQPTPVNSQSKLAIENNQYLALTHNNQAEPTLSPRTSKTVSTPRKNQSNSLFYVGMKDLMAKFSLGEYDERGHRRDEMPKPVKEEKTISDRMRPPFVSTIRRSNEANDNVMLDDWFDPPLLPLRMHDSNPPT